MAKKVCVIGAGAAGLVSVKECLASKFDVVCFERGSNIGGLWRYHDEDDDESASVAQSTIINSSKELSAYSDFPPPPEVPNYMHHSQMIKYFESYAEHFGLRSAIKFNHDVIRVEKTKDYFASGRWEVTVVNRNQGDPIKSTLTFDAVMICTGHHVRPLWPKFEGVEQFKGRVMHTHSFKKADPFAGDRVLIVGGGNSGADAAAEVAKVASKVFWSIRRGVWIYYRYSKKGHPLDSKYLRRFWNYLRLISPYEISCAVIERRVN